MLSNFLENNKGKTFSSLEDLKKQLKKEGIEFKEDNKKINHNKKNKSSNKNKKNDISSKSKNKIKNKEKKKNKPNNTKKTKYYDKKVETIFTVYGYKVYIRFKKSIMDIHCSNIQTVIKIIDNHAIDIRCFDNNTLNIIKSKRPHFSIYYKNKLYIKARFDIYDLKNQCILIKIDHIVNIPIDENDIEKNKSYVKINVYSSDYFSLYDQYSAITSIQIISGSNNHITKNHKISDKTVNIIYMNKIYKKYSVIKIILHFCEQCKVYFDFEESFLIQLKKLNINPSDLLIKILDKNMQSYSIDGDELANESFLHSLGYVCGRTKGLSKKERQNLLMKIIDREIMTISQIKNSIEFNIRMFGNNPNYTYALMDWKSDIDFLNEYIKSHCAN